MCVTCAFGVPACGVVCAPALQTFVQIVTPLGGMGAAIFLGVLTTAGSRAVGRQAAPRVEKGTDASE